MAMEIRGGNRGGKDLFTWDEVKGDKDRENYLGHSLMAPVGRWQQGKDLSWYAKGKRADAESIRRAEINAAKQREANYMAAALGYNPGVSLLSTGEKLSKQEIAEVCKRGQFERDDNDIERVRGMGFTSVIGKNLSLTTSMMHVRDKKTDKSGGSMTAFEEGTRVAPPPPPPLPSSSSSSSRKDQRVNRTALFKKKLIASLSVENETGAESSGEKKHKHRSKEKKSKKKRKHRHNSDDSNDESSSPAKKKEKKKKEKKKKKRRRSSDSDA